LQPKFKNFTLYILMLIVILAIFSHFYSEKKVKNLHYSNFITMVKRGEVINVKVKHLEIEFIDKKNQSFTTIAPQAINPPYLDLVMEKVKHVEFVPLEDWPGWVQILFNLAPWVIIIGLWFYFISKMQSGAPRGMSFGRSRAKTFSETKEKTTFNDVAGCDEAKDELAEVIDFLKYPNKYKKTGARVPRGVLMMGPPGTGKTLLARAVAGEANVPFFHISGSDFVEMFVGVGASRVRDLFEQGKKSSPCLIFIDEIDAVGRQRGQGISGGNDEREQTLNQLLVEMDGFEGDTGIMVIAATNRPDILDKALLRPGRFDRQVTIELPDIKGREGIIKVHMANIPVNEAVDVQTLAKATPGFSGADLANMVNEAALLAARYGHALVSTEHFEEARDKVMMGPERRSKVMSDKELKNTAYHEAGHALISLLVPNSMEIHKATIIPRGRTLGMVSFLPKEDSSTKEEFIDGICVALGGRCAEELVFQTCTPGAFNDIQQATNMARNMVTKFGMSQKLGPINYSENTENFFGIKSYSEQTAREIDSEIHTLIEAQLGRAKKLLEGHRDELDSIANSLISHETLTLDDLKKLMEGEEIGPPRPNLLQSRVDSPPPDEEETMDEENEQEPKAEEDSLPERGAACVDVDEDAIAKENCDSIKQVSSDKQDT
jgi:cell division protease FtsH